jgi:hypothetical protein
MERFGAQNSPDRVLFVMDSWLTPMERRTADACWVLEEGVDVVSYMAYLDFVVPVLLPGRIPSFLPETVAARCHLWQNAFDVSAILPAI